MYLGPNEVCFDPGACRTPLLGRNDFLADKDDCLRFSSLGVETGPAGVSSIMNRGENEVCVAEAL